MTLNLSKKLLLVLASLLLSTTIVFAEETQDNLMAPFQLNLVKTESYPVDLETMLKLAVNNNLPLQVAEQNKYIDKCNEYVAISQFLPDITPSYGQNRFQGGVQIFGNQIFNIYRTTVQPQLLLSYTLHSGGENIYNYLAAKRQLKATMYSINVKHDKLLYDASCLYYNLQQAIKHLEIAKQEVEESKAILNLNQKRLDNGLGTILDVSQSEEQLAFSKNKYILANRNILQLSQRLNELLNLPLNVSVMPSSSDIEKKTLLNEYNPEKLLNIALENRPDLKEVYMIKKVYLAQRGIARSKFFPDITLNTYINGSGPRFADLESNRYIGYSVSFDFLKNMGMNYVANYKKSTPMLKQVDLQIQEKLREIETNIANTSLDIESADRYINVAKTGLKYAEDSFKYATERLSAGVGTYVDVLTTQTRLTQARTDLVDSIIVYNKSQIGLIHSLGLININKILGLEPVLPANTQPNTLEIKNIGSSTK